MAVYKQLPRIKVPYYKNRQYLQTENAIIIGGMPIKLIMIILF